MILSMMTLSMMTLSIMTLSITTLNITTLSIMTLNITKLRIKSLFATLSMNDTEYYNTAIMLSVLFNLPSTECRCAENHLDALY